MEAGFFGSQIKPRCSVSEWVAVEFCDCLLAGVFDIITTININPTTQEISMSLDAEVSKLSSTQGTITIDARGASSQITVEGFEGDNCSCRDVAVQACLWAIGELQREISIAVQKPGGNIIVN